MKIHDWGTQFPMFKENTPKLDTFVYRTVCGYHSTQSVLQQHALQTTIRNVTRTTTDGMVFEEHPDEVLFVEWRVGVSAIEGFEVVDVLL